MKFSALLLAATVGVQTGLGHPGMGKKIEQIELLARQQPGGGLSTELLGNLVGLPDNKLTSTGRDIRNILTGKAPAESDKQGLRPLPATSKLCKADTCCVWHHVADDMEELFRGKSGLCTGLARQAIRLGFHDAGTWSKAGGGGGADGSIVLSNEIDRFENAAMKPVANEYKKIYARYHDELGYGSLTMADVVQFGATVATVVCPLGPRVKSFVGRPDVRDPAPEGRLPSPFAAATALIDSFADKTISARGLVALLGAHTVSQQTVINTTRAGDPQDSTPGVFDNLYFGQTLGTVFTPARVFKFLSDINLSQHPATKPIYEEFAKPGAQRGWNKDYAREYVRLSLLGVKDINGLTDCTKALPRSTTKFIYRDQHKLDKWLKTIDWSSISKLISQLLEGGKHLDNVDESKIPTVAPKAGTAPA